MKLASPDGSAPGNMLQRHKLRNSTSQGSLQAVVDRRRRRPQMAAAGPTPAPAQAPRRAAPVADPRIADSSSSRRHHKPLRLGRSSSSSSSSSSGGVRHHRRRRPEPAGTQSPSDLRQRQPQQSQPQLPWERHDQCTKDASDLASSPATSSTATAEPADASVQPLTQPPVPPPAAAIADAAQAAALSQAASARPDAPRPPRRIRQPKESDQERVRRLRRQALSESYWRAQVDLSTGFPVPLGYATVHPRADVVRQSWQAADRYAAAQCAELQDAAVQQHIQQQQMQQHQGAAGQLIGAGLHAPTPSSGVRWPSSLRPSFRSSPRNAQRRQPSDTCARILFLDEGNTCRSVLAESIFRSMLEACDTPLSVAVESASMGPAVDGQHDPRVAQVAHSMGLQLAPRRARMFDEVNDIVGCDLVLVMDSFDATEVLREVAVLDAINRGGSHSMRIRQLGPFSSARRRVSPLEAFVGLDEIADPLYGNTGGAGEAAALRETVRHLQLACAGLLNYLVELGARSVAGVSLRAALEQSLRCPLLGAASGTCSLVRPPKFAPDARRRRRAAAGRVTAQREQPMLPKQLGQPEEEKAPSSLQAEAHRSSERTRPRGYWRDTDNVERELRGWMAEHSLDSRLPTNRELRASGDNSLAIAITAYHGGYIALGKRMRLRTQRSAGQFKQWDNVASAIRPLLELECDGECSIDWDAVDAAGALPPGSGSRAADATDAEEVPEGCRLVMPTQAEMSAAAGSQLVKAVHGHGGVFAVARRLGVSVRNSKLSTMEAVEEDVHAFIQQQRLPQDALPCRAQLLAAGRQDLANAVTRFGGYQKMARHLGLRFLDPRGGRLDMSAAGAAPIAEGSRDGAAAVAAIPSTPVAAAAHGRGGAGRQSDGLATAAGKAVPLPAGMEQSPALREAAVEMAVLMREQHLSHVPGRAELEAAGHKALYHKVMRSGGIRRLAKLLGMPFNETVGRAKRGYPVTKLKPRRSGKAGDDFVWI